MSKRITEKIEEIETYLQELGEIIPATFEEYKTDFTKKAACERYFERIIEAIVDLAFIIIKEKKLKTPEEDKETFDILSAEEIIIKKLAEKLKDAKGMRNILAHEYGKIDDELVFNSLAEELFDDIEEFLRNMKK